MTLADLIPSLRGLVQSRLEPGIWPGGTRLTTNGDLVIGGVSTALLATRFGTPVHVLDEAEVRLRCRAYQAKLPATETAYAAATAPCREVLRWVEEEQLSLGAGSSRELAVARSASFPAHRVLVRGNALTAGDLAAALAYGAGRIVLGSFAEIERLASLADHCQPVLLAVAAGTGRALGEAGTGRALGEAGGLDSRPAGFPLHGGAAAMAVRRVLARPNLRLVGLHCHLGPQISRIGEYELAARRMVGLLGAIRDEHGIVPRQLDLGGGHPEPCAEGVPGFDLHGFATRVGGAVNFECTARRLPVPHLIVEPGSALIAPAGLTLCRVAVVDRSARMLVALDGPVPSPAADGSPPVLRMVGRVPVAPLRPATVDGLPHDVPLPEDIRPGDLVAISRTGASHHPGTADAPTVTRSPLVAVAAGVTRVLSGPPEVVSGQQTALSGHSGGQQTVLSGQQTALSGQQTVLSGQQTVFGGPIRARSGPPNEPADLTNTGGPE